MFQEMADAGEASASAGAAGPRVTTAALGPTVARLCDALAEGDVIAVAANEQRGEAIARAAAALTDALVVWYPASDGLPGEAAAPALAGRRFAALAAVGGRAREPVLLVTDAAAASFRVAPPKA